MLAVLSLITEPHGQHGHPQGLKSTSPWWLGEEGGLWMSAEIPSDPRGVQAASIHLTHATIRTSSPMLCREGHWAMTLSWEHCTPQEEGRWLGRQSMAGGGAVMG